MNITQWTQASTSTEVSPISDQLASGAMYWDAINTARGSEWYRLISRDTQDVIGSVKTEYDRGYHYFAKRNDSGRGATFSDLKHARAFVELAATEVSHA